MAIFNVAKSGRSYVSTDIVGAAINDITPTWLRKITTDIINSARANQPKFGSAQRSFFAVTQGLHSQIRVTGPRVEKEAFDNIFRVPAGGFKPGDIDPKTGEPFPVGKGKHGQYIILEDKPTTVGEDIKYRTRVYTKHSGKTIFTEGFLSRALREHLGVLTLPSTRLSTTSQANLLILSIALGMNISQRITDIIVADARSRGYVVSWSPPAFTFRV